MQATESREDVQRGRTAVHGSHGQPAVHPHHVQAGDVGASGAGTGKHDHDAAMAAAAEVAHADNVHELMKDLPKIGTLGMLALLAAAVVLMGALFMLGYGPHRQRESELEAGAAEAHGVSAAAVVDVIRPKRSPASSDLTLPGDARPMQSTAIYPRASGYLKDQNVDIGSRVKRGGVLAVISQPEVDAELRQTRAALEQAKANVVKAMADAALAKATLASYEELGQTDFVTKQQLDEKRAAVSQTASAVEAVKAAVASAEATVQRLSDLQGFATIAAPFDGTITARNYDIGALLTANNTGGAGREMYRLEETETLRVIVNVPQAYATAVRTGDEASFFVRNYPGRPFKGKIARSAESVDPATRTQRFELEVGNAEHLLSPGMYGQVKLQVHEERPGFILPTSALVFRADGMKVATVADGKIQYRTVTVGRDFGPEAEIHTGLSGDELVVANPSERLGEGMEVTAKLPVAGEAGAGSASVNQANAKQPR